MQETESSRVAHDIGEEINIAGWFISTAVRAIHADSASSVGVEKAPKAVLPRPTAVACVHGASEDRRARGCRRGASDRDGLIGDVYKRFAVTHDERVAELHLPAGAVVISIDNPWRSRTRPHSNPGIRAAVQGIGVAGLPVKVDGGRSDPEVPGVIAGTGVGGLLKEAVFRTGGITRRTRRFLADARAAVLANLTAFSRLATAAAFALFALVALFAATADFATRHTE